MIHIKCKNYTCDCDNATTCPCLEYEECDNYCHSCRQDFVTTDDEGLYYHHCKLDKDLVWKMRQELFDQKGIWVELGKDDIPEDVKII